MISLQLLVYYQNLGLLGQLLSPYTWHHIPIISHLSLLLTCRHVAVLFLLSPCTYRHTTVTYTWHRTLLWLVYCKTTLLRGFGYWGVKVSVPRACDSIFLRNRWWFTSRLSNLLKCNRCRNRIFFASFAALLWQPSKVLGIYRIFQVWRRLL